MPRVAGTVVLLVMVIACPQVWANPATPPASQPAMPTTPGYHKLKYQVHVGNHTMQMAYLLGLPRGYDTSKEPRPVVVFLHGSGECGTDLNGVMSVGMVHDMEAKPSLRDSAPFILIAPQCPPRGQRWDQAEMVHGVVALLDEILPRLCADPDRVYLTGLSMGGTGTWHVALAAPERFAAIAPISAAAVRPEEAGKKLSRLAVWAIAGVNDPDACNGASQMAQAINQAGGSARVTIGENMDHTCWYAFYSNAQFYEWLLAHRRTSRPPSSPAAVPGSSSFVEFQTQVDNHLIQLPYSLYLPKGYSAGGGPRPLLLFLHPSDVIGTDLPGMCLHGPELAIQSRGNEPLHDSLPLMVVSPRCPVDRRWDQPEMAKALLALLEELARKLPVDKSRIYVSGLDTGAQGICLLAQQAPSRFAAVAPVFAARAFAAPPDGLEHLKGVCLWNVVSDSQQALADQIRQFYGSREFYEWMLKHRLPQGK